MESGDNKVQRFSKSWLCLALIILFVVFVRVRLSEFPLERDEGEYAYTAQLMLQGIAPYGEAYTMKFPGTSLMYALIMVLLGQTTQGIHLGLMLVNCLTILLVFILSKRIVGEFPALAAGATYAVLSLSSSVFGFADHATHFVIMPVIGGSLLLLIATEKNKTGLHFLSGMLFGLGFVMKQQGLFFLAFGPAYLMYHYFSSKPAPVFRETLVKVALFSTGAMVPFSALLVWTYVSGGFDKFWFWTIEYAAKYVTQLPWSVGVANFKEAFSSVVDGFYLLWCFSAVGLITVLFHRTMKTDRGFILLFTAFSFFTICPGLYFRAHYFVTLLPAVAILVGIFFDYWGGRIGSFFKISNLRVAGIAIFLVASGIGVFSQKGYLFEEAPAKLSKKIYGRNNPFLESVVIAKFIKSRSLETDRIAVLGSEPQIYFYSQRLAATGYLYVYPLMESHEFSLAMQKEMISEIESSRPKFLIVVGVDESWTERPTSEQYIFGWRDKYIRSNYTLVGVVDIAPPETVFKWDDDARKYTGQSMANVLIFERK
jgi:4-amino-4-deoxy-L-arabinose transferase-like glycosyltransferase